MRYLRTIKTREAAKRACPDAMAVIRDVDGGFVALDGIEDFEAYMALLVDQVEDSILRANEKIGRIINATTI